MKDMYLRLAQKKRAGLVRVQKDQPPVGPAELELAKELLLRTRGRKHGTAEFIPVCGVAKSHDVISFAWELTATPLFRGRSVFNGKRF
jgi:hypothetical protein